jgi:hypothetical protein
MLGRSETPTCVPLQVYPDKQQNWTVEPLLTKLVGGTTVTLYPFRLVNGCSGIFACECLFYPTLSPRLIYQYLTEALYISSEFLFADGRSRLLTFSTHKRDDALKKLKNCIRRSVGPEVLSHMNLSLKSQTELWQNGQISNQAYLLYLNDAGELIFFLKPITCCFHYHSRCIFPISKLEGLIEI